MSGSSPSSSSQTSNTPSWRIFSAAARVSLTISSGSLPGTQVVMKATRVPGSGATGTGSLAASMACTLETTLTSRKTSIRAIATSMIRSATGRYHGIVP